MSKKFDAEKYSIYNSLTILKTVLNDIENYYMITELRSSTYSRSNVMELSKIS